MTAQTRIDALLAEAGAHRAAGRFAQAEALLREAVRLAPQSAAALTNHGLLLSDLGRHAEAADEQRAALALDAQFAPAWLNLALALQAAGDLAGAAAARERALQLDPRAPAALVQRGMAAQRAGRLTDAITAYRDALRQDAHLPEAWINLGTALQTCGDAPAARTALQQALALAPHDRRAASNLLMGGQYQAGLDSATLRADTQRAGALWGTATTPPAVQGPIGPGERLRVGYLSSDLCAHPVGWLLAPVLAAHDRAVLEVHVYAGRAAPPDAMTARLRAAAEHWHDIAGLDDAAAAALMRSHGLDLLVELGGHTEGSRLGVVALRPAPVQLSWLGWFASTGLAAVDAVVLGEALAPPGSEAFYTEPLERLPRPHFAYTPPPDAPAPAPPPSLRLGSVTFGSFNNPAKLSDATVALWSQLLRAVPGSQLVLKWSAFADPQLDAMTRNRFGAQAPRVQPRGASPHAQMLAEYGDIDIALDPHPFSGLLTTLEALAMGVPVLTLPGPRPVSRQTAAVLQAMGLDTLVAATPQAYIERAAALAADTATRSAWRSPGPQGLRERLAASSVGDGAGLARALEALYARRAAAHRSAAGA
uniref:protein O-GlcNAc transferase n=1 Tax=uncultured microorganism TaxID=358574 RepID=F8UHZ4_9ZZZZ|nr:TPR repeat-containing protein [uncultured microorganism]